MTAHPADLSAVEARRLIGTRALSPVDLFEACLERIEAANPTINAIISMDVADGRRQARDAADAVANGEPLGTLHGIPVAIKDNRATKGLRTTHGSLLFEDHVPHEDEPGVAALRRAGAIIFAKTNLPEFGAGGNTTNRVFGPTSNPHHSALTSGGSSGGAAAALAAHMTPLATGSDYGGSLRTPASFCGVCGFRPSLGFAPLFEGAPLSPWGVNGPMGRTIADTHLLLQEMALHDPRDPFSHAGQQATPVQPADLSSLRVAFSEDLGAAPVAASVRALFRERTELLRPRVNRAADTAPDFADAHKLFDVTRGIAFLAAHGDRVKEQADQLDRNVIDNCAAALQFSMEDVGWAHREQGLLYRRVVAFFEEFDVLVAPAASVPPFEHKQLFVDRIDDMIMDNYMRWLAISYMPTLGFCCSAAIPCGQDSNGLPFGIQIIGPHGSDMRVLSIASAFERVLSESFSPKTL